MTEKERLISLLEDLPEPDVHAALRFVEYLHRAPADPVLRALWDAPFDGEPLTDVDLLEIEASESDREAGRTVSHEEARRESL